MKRFVKKEYIITTLFLLIGWHILGIVVNNDVIIPMPVDVLVTTSTLFIKKEFYIALFSTVLRVVKACAISLFISLFISLLGYRYAIVKRLFAPISLMLKTIPNISYIIVCLIWFGANSSVTIICFLILFPIMYSNITSQLDQFNNDYGDIMKIYYEKFSVVLSKNLVPYLCPYIIQNLKTTMSLGFKVCVMAEILGQVKYGIGKMLYLSKMNLDMTSLFAYTLIIILVCLVIDFVFDNLLHIYKLGGNK